MAKKDLSKENPISSRPNIDHLIKRIILEKRKEKKKKSFSYMFGFDIWRIKHFRYLQLNKLITFTLTPFKFPSS